MQEYITVDRIINSIFMDFDSKITYLIVEGVNDQILFDKFISNCNCNITIAFGKTNVFNAISRFMAENKLNCLGIVDSDYNRLQNINIENEHLLTLDCHDIEIMVLNSSALQIVLNAIASKIKLKNFLKTIDITYLDTILELAKVVSY